jgi:hypothetical protein
VPCCSGECQLTRMCGVVNEKFSLRIVRICFLALAAYIPYESVSKSLHHQAILETDWTKIEERIQAAESAMGARLQEFSLNMAVHPKKINESKTTAPLEGA